MVLGFPHASFLAGGETGPKREADNLTVICEPIV
jgi:hypothetical protein